MKARRILSIVLALLMALGCCGAALAEQSGEGAGVLDFLPDAKPAPEDDLYGYVNFDRLHAVEIPSKTMWRSRRN